MNYICIIYIYIYYTYVYVYIYIFIVSIYVMYIIIIYIYIVISVYTRYQISPHTYPTKKLPSIVVSSHRSGQVGVSHLPTRHRLRPGLSTRPWSAGPGSDRTDGGGRCRSAAGGGGHRRCLGFVGLFWNASKQWDVCCVFMYFLDFCYCPLSFPSVS